MKRWFPLISLIVFACVPLTHAADKEKLVLACQGTNTSTLMGGKNGPLESVEKTSILLTVDFPRNKIFHDTPALACFLGGSCNCRITEAEIYCSSMKDPIQNNVTINRLSGKLKSTQIRGNPSTVFFLLESDLTCKPYSPSERKF